MSTPVLEVTDLAIDFAQPRPAVNSISVRVDPGEVVALVGESGSGKSMTARAVLGLLPPGARRHRVGAGATAARSSALRRRCSTRCAAPQVAMVFQEPQTALNPVRTVGWQIREALRAHRKVSRIAARDRAVELLRDVEMPDPERRVDYYPHQLSGGQKQRVVLALALANEPDLLLADEPTTALDVTVQAEILALLRRLRDRTGASILLITHNMGVVAEMADRVVVLKTGDVVEEADTATLFAAPRHPYTRQLLSAVLRLPEQGGYAAEPAAEAADRAADELRLEDVTVVYPGRHGAAAFTAAHEVSLDVRAGEVLGLVGESGSGKTTLGRLAAGLVPAAAGRVLCRATTWPACRASRLREIRRDLAFVHQDPAASLDPRLTVAETSASRSTCTARATGPPGAPGSLELLDAVRLPADHADRMPRELSGGQRQRVALARALALRRGW